MMGSVRCVTCLFLCAALGSTAAPAGAETLKEKLDREMAAMDSLSATLEQDRKALTRIELKKLSVGTQLDRLQQSAVRTKRELRSLAAKERNLSTRVKQTREALAAAERKLKDRKSGIAERLRTSYKLSRQDPLMVLFTGSSLSEGVRRLKYLGRAAQQDRADMAAIAAGREEVRRNLRLRQIQYAHQQTLIRATEKKESELHSSATEYSSKLRSLGRDENLTKATILENNERYVESQNRIGEIIKELERQRLAGMRLVELPDFDFAGKRGALPWPVRGKILTRFGRVQDPDLGTWTMNRGVTISAGAGTDVLAVAPGEVMLIDWWRGYGQLVLLRHPSGYYTLYSHLESRSVEIGEILAEGALIGTVGSTGRLDGVPQLNFEIMQEEQPLDPTGWLEP